MLNTMQKSKVAQVIHYLIKLQGKRLPYTKALKLLYLIDRRSLNKHGYTVTDDDYRSLANGPVLIDTMDAIKREITDREFAQLLSKNSRNELIVAVDDCEYDLLSRTDLDLIEGMHDQYGHLNTEQLIDLTHELPEWKELGSSAIRISIEAMSRALEPSDPRRALSIAEGAERDRALGRLSKPVV